MKHSTKFLFGVDREFFEPELTILARKKVDKAREVMKVLSFVRPYTSKEAMPYIIKRYQGAEQALNWWTEILEED